MDPLPSYDEFSDADLTFWVVTPVDKGEQVGTRGQDGAELLIFGSSPRYAVFYNHISGLKEGLQFLKGAEFGYPKCASWYLSRFEIGLRYA